MGARGMNERRKYALKKYAAIRIQAQWRRYITRETYLYVLQYRNTKATKIQANWRGYLSRKYKFHYYKLVSARNLQYDAIRNSPPPLKSSGNRGYSRILGAIDIENNVNSIDNVGDSDGDNEMEVPQTENSSHKNGANLTRTQLEDALDEVDDQSKTGEPS